jgi:hypothetical protein
MGSNLAESWNMNEPEYKIPLETKRDKTKSLADEEFFNVWATGDVVTLWPIEQRDHSING